jgi:UDP-N-acetyl-D-glucosamine dehydrogenase
MEKLRERGAKIEFADPFVPSIQFAGSRMRSVPTTAASLRRFDCAVVATAHKGFKYGEILRYSRAVVDTRNALVGKRSRKIVRL